jgi:hypothetical protein
MLSSVDYQEVLQMRREFAALRFDWERTKRDYYARKYRPDQPRVPAGSREGGQWTDDGGSDGSSGGGDASPNGNTSTSRARLADANNISDPTVMSDASPDPIIPGAQYAQTQIVIKPSALTGISSVDEKTKLLANTLARVMDGVDYAPDLGPRLYGIEVHTAFAAALRFQQIPGIEVEPTFGGPYYGAKDSVRPDAILRNDAGDIVAIYDVKTGERSIDPKRAAELRVSAGVGNSVPVIELSIPYGVRRKNAPFEESREAFLRAGNNWRF